MVVSKLSTDEFVKLMKEHDTRRVFWVWDPGSNRVRVSHSFLEESARDLEQDTVDFQRHEGIFLELGEETGALLGAFVHNTVRGQAAGGVRYWNYATMAAFLNDGIRLAKGMTHKNALAGLWWGGGKGVIARDSRDYRDPVFRKQIYQDYGRMMTNIRGCYITAEDAGTNTEDMATVFSTTRFTTCIPERLGGSGNPSVPTARGVVSGMEAALEHLDKGTLEGKKVAIQGLGNVGLPLVRFLFEKGVASVIGSDVDQRRQEEMKAVFPEVEVSIVDPLDMSILAADVDIVSPCATGGTLNNESIPTIRASVVCGAANNQLRVPAEDGVLMRKHGVAYVPDFLTNRMGIVNCANEQYGYVPDDTDFTRHLGRDWENSIFLLTKKVLANAEKTGQATDIEAVHLAEKYARTPHPVMGHRGARIIAGLVADHWERGP